MKIIFCEEVLDSTLFLQPFQPVVSPSPGAIAGWMTNPTPSIPHHTVTAVPPGLVQTTGAGKEI